MEQATVQLDYFYGIQAEQFSFLRIPKILIKDGRFEHLSNEAKMLFGLLLDRMSLSIKNKWFDEDNRVFIVYTISEIMVDLCIGSQKCVKLLKELEAYGLIERKKQGFSQPDIIYVKNFATLAGDGDEIPKEMESKVRRWRDKKSEKDDMDISDSSENGEKSSVFRKSKHEDFENQNATVSEIKTREFPKSKREDFENQNSSVLKIETPEFRKSKPNNTDISDTDKNNTDSNDTDVSINQSITNAVKEDDGLMDGAYDLYSVIKQDEELQRKIIEHSRVLQSGESYDSGEYIKTVMNHGEVLSGITYDRYCQDVEKYSLGQDDKVNLAKDALDIKFEGMILRDTKEISSSEANMLRTLVNYMAQIIGLGETVYINGARLSSEYLGRRFFRLNRDLILYVLKNIKDNSRKITNRKSYYIQCLLNAENDNKADEYDDLKTIAG